MATAKKTTAAKKSTASKATTAKSASAKKKTAPRASTTKSAKATSARVNDIPGGREAKFAEQALGFIDEAAALLRDSVHSGAETTARARLAARRRATSLITKASNNLNKAIGDGTSVAQSLIGRIL